MKWIVVVMLACGVVSAQAQQRDSLVRAVSDSNAFAMQKSPLTATLLSAIVPGAGQFYNEDYLKIPLYWAIGGFLAYEVITNNNGFLDWQDRYFNSPDSLVRKSQTAFQQKEAYRDNRDYYGAFLFLVYVVNVLDAYVGAHLFDFPAVRDGRPGAASIRLAPLAAPSGRIGLGLHVVF